MRPPGVMMIIHILREAWEGIDLAIVVSSIVAFSFACNRNFPSRFEPLWVNNVP